MGQIKWTERASSNLQAIFEYISKDSRIYAARFVKALIAATRKLEMMPRCGREVPELENPELREVIYGNYRIIYRIAGSEDTGCDPRGSRHKSGNQGGMGALSGGTGDPHYGTSCSHRTRTIQMTPAAIK
ncbi:MAG: type II toxin-antitoxin system RelE/ParE family toxin [Deltaproteobacteria bacterium]|nr:type II toxin-antitoxin system RelE/ParE family toxin [Deltaproteobacteria bacterium]